MAKARNPVTFGEEFGIASQRLSRLGVLDVTLAIDTKLFIDPLLLESSRHPELSGRAVALYHSHFDQIIRLLKASGRPGDPAWKAATRLLQFPEVRGTCLGYGAGSIHGSGFGKKLSGRLINVAKDIIDIGIEDPDLFTAMALFEPDIGPDRISDMVTNIIFDALAEFNKRVLDELKIRPVPFRSGGRDYLFARNPYEPTDTPVILVPTDVLRDLPIAYDWDSVRDAASQNDELRDRVNNHVGEIWAAKTKRDKKSLKAQAMAGLDAFQALLDALHATNAQPYDVEHDPEGLVIWATRGQQYANQNPLALIVPTSLGELHDLVMTIIGQFRHLVESCGLNKELYRENRTPRHESTAQRLFFAVAYSYCKANDVDVAPEIDTGTGKIDFKFSRGFAMRVLVEIKLSTNAKVVSGYLNQLEEYKQSQETMRAAYLVIDVGGMGKKDERLINERNRASKEGLSLSDLEFVDGTLKAPPSKRRKEPIQP